MRSRMRFVQYLEGFTGGSVEGVAAETTHR